MIPLFNSIIILRVSLFSLTFPLSLWFFFFKLKWKYKKVFEYIYHLGNFQIWTNKIIKFQKEQKPFEVSSFYN